MNALKIHLQKSTLFREQDGTESFCPSNLEGFFFGVCAQVGCFERRHEAEIYGILLRCVEGTVGFFCIIHLQLWKATKTCDIKRPIRRPQLCSSRNSSFLPLKKPWGHVGHFCVEWQLCCLHSRRDFWGSSLIAPSAWCDSIHLYR